MDGGGTGGGVSFGGAVFRRLVFAIAAAAGGVVKRLKIRRLTLVGCNLTVLYMEFRVVCAFCTNCFGLDLGDIA